MIDLAKQAMWYILYSSGRYAVLLSKYYAC